MVARNEQGQLVGAAVRWDRANWTPLVAEAKSMLLGMQLALFKGWQDVEVESDCHQLVSALTNRDLDIHDVEMVLRDITAVHARFRSCTWSFVKRDANWVAHEMAAFLPGTEHNFHIWWDEFPDFLKAATDKDRDAAILGISASR